MKNVLKVLGLVVWFSARAMAQDSTSEVWNHHVGAWQAKSLSEIAVDYDDQSVLVLNNQVYKGQAQIREVFERLFQIFDGGVNVIDTPLVFDRFVYITWHLTPPGMSEYFGTDTFVIENGKIALQTIASTLYGEFPVPLAVPSLSH